MRRSMPWWGDIRGALLRNNLGRYRSRARYFRMNHNYIALREIQPWLIALTDKVKDTGAQCLLISHHPELIDYLAADCGLRFFRENGGPVRVQPFEWTADDAIRPAEVVARGWEDR